MQSTRGNIRQGRVPKRRNVRVSRGRGVHGLDPDPGNEAGFAAAIAGSCPVRARGARVLVLTTLMGMFSIGGSGSPDHDGVEYVITKNKKWRTDRAPPW